MKKIIFAILISVVFFAFADSISAQSKARKPKKSTTSSAAKTPVVTTAPPTETPVKKNERPTETAGNENSQATETAKKVNNNPKANARSAQDEKSAPVYFYTFSQPQFLVSKIFIEHDENGRGKIAFKKKDFADLITDPLQLSPATLERVKTIFESLNFLDSKETYQSAERNYAHLGTMTFAEKKDGRSRNVEFNWTENKDAKLLADEYRKIAQQFVWIFDMNVARENQQLETPALMDALDSLIKRGEISDAVQMLPFLRELSTDERLPLIARNHATRIVKEIEKKADKK